MGLALLLARGAGADPPPGMTLVGVVRERGTRRPVAGAEVVVVPSSTAVAATGTALSGADGAFRVDSIPAGLVGVTVTAFGYLPLHERLELTASVTGTARLFAMDPGFGGIPEVEVVSRARRGAGQQVMTRAEAREVPGTAGDPLRAVAALPGITPASDIDSNLYVRGSGPADNAQYVDGIPAGYPYHFQGVASTFQAESVEALRFHTGGFPARFGNRTGGIFDLVTRAAPPNRLTGTAGISLVASSLTAEGPVPGTGVSALGAVRRGYFDLVLPRRVTDVAVPSYTDYLGTLTRSTAGAGTFTLEMFGAEDAAVAQVRSRSAPSAQGEFRWAHSYHVGAARWTGRAGPATLAAVAAGHLAGNSVDLGSGYFFHERPAEGYGRLAATGEAGPHRIEAGMEGTYTRHRLDTYFARLPSEGQGSYSFTALSKIRSSSSLLGRRIGAWVTDRWEPGTAWSVEAGGRVDGDSLTHDLAASPRLAARLALSPRARLLAAGGLYRQPPRTLELMPQWGNPRLGGSRAWHAILGAEAERGAWTVSLEAYDKELAGLSVPDPALVYVNAGTGRATGVELLVRRDFSERVAGWLGYTFASSWRRDGPGTAARPSDYDVPHAATATCRVRLSPGWSVSGRWRLATGLPYTPVTGRAVTPTGEAMPLFGRVNSARLPPYHRLDLRVEYQARFDAWTLAPFVEFLNAYNRANLATVVWSANLDGERRIRQMPRTVFGGLEARF